MVRVARWPVRAARPLGRLRIVMVADLHAADPWMSLGRVDRILDQAQALGGDLIAVLGDFPGHLPLSRPVAPDALAARIARLRAPLGVWAVLGNHDWHDDPAAVARGSGPTLWHDALGRSGVEVLENRGVELRHVDRRFALVGVGSQRAFGRRRAGADDLDAALGSVPGDLPVVLLAHEPDIFATVPDPVVLTLSGHTHGGQITFGGFAPVVPSAFGRRYVYGHVRERGRDLVVSGGLGCSGVPIRIGARPELTVVDLE